MEFLFSHIKRLDRQEACPIAEKRKDSRERNLRIGEYYDSKNKRYMFRKKIDGERVTITAANLVELRAQENELLCRIDKGNKLNTRNARMTLNVYFDFWMNTFAKSSRKSTTCMNYKSYYNIYIKNTIGIKQIAKITKADCQRIVNEIIISKNPAKNLQVPQTESRKRAAIEQRQVDLFMEYVKNNMRYSYSYPAFVVLFNLGLRIGKLAALTWDEISFSDGVITINKTVNRYRKADYGFTMGVASPKSKTSIRKISINSIVKAELLKLNMKNVPSSISLPYVDDSGHVRGTVTGFAFTNTYGNGKGLILYTDEAGRNKTN